jgi:hypothetical protein
MNKPVNKQQELPLSAITCLDYLQQRTVNLIADKNELYRQQANLSATTVKVTNDLINNGSIQVPLEIHEVDGKYLLVDGHHRYQGILEYCKEAKLDHNIYQVPVNITKNSTEHAAITASFKVNLSHGVGLSPEEVKQVTFRRYVWSRSVPKIAAIRADIGCSQGTASNITKAAKWCIGRIEVKGVNIKTPEELKVFMTKEMTELYIDSDLLDAYGLPSYSLLIKAFRGDNYTHLDINDSHRDSVNYVMSVLVEIENMHGVEALRDALRHHKTAAHGITVSQNSKWKDKPSTASLLARESRNRYGF